MRRALIVGACAGLALMSGCAPSPEARGLAQSAATFASKADPILRSWYEAEQVACFKRSQPERVACVQAVRERWRPIRVELERVRAAWCELEPEKCR